MKRHNAVIRIAICLAFLSVGALILADALGFIPNKSAMVREQRKAICESIAVHCSMLASRGELSRLETLLQLMAQRNDELESIGLRREDGKLLVDIGNHASKWHPTSSELSTDTHVFVPILSADRQWGKVELHFSQAKTQTWLGNLNFSVYELFAVAGAVNFMLFFPFSAACPRTS